MHNLQRYSQTTSHKHALLLIFLAPLPCLLCVILCDLILLEAPEKGLSHSHTFWLRAFLITWLIDFTVLEQCRHFIPMLFMTVMQNAAVTLFAAAGATAIMFSLSNVIGYPLPFIAYMWEKLVRGNPGIQSDILNYALVVVAQVALTYIYPAYNHVFIKLADLSQTAFALLLPVLKIVAKNCLSHFFHNMKDFKPEVVIFNFEVFHALFVAYCIQHSTSIHTTVMLMFVNFIQACAGLRDADIMLQSLHGLLYAVDANEDSACIRRPVKMKQVAPVSASPASSDLNILSSVLYVLSIDKQLQTSASLRLTTQVGNSGVWRVSLDKQQQSAKTRAPVINQSSYSDRAATGLRESQDTTRTENRSMKSQEQTLRADPDALRPASSSMSVILDAIATQAAELSDTNKLRLGSMSGENRQQFVQQTLQLLHFIEFLLLIEFTEVIIPAIYCVYLGVISHLPNCQFYASLRGLDDASVQHNIRNVMIYASLELLSLVMLTALLYRKLRISPLKQLLFVLEKQWRLIQSMLIVWVDHFGVDYSFKLYKIA